MLEKKIRFALTEGSRFDEDQVSIGRGKLSLRSGSSAGDDKKREAHHAEESTQRPSQYALYLVKCSSHDEDENTEKGGGLPGLHMTTSAFIVKADVVLGEDVNA
jgi:hypothetical protein